MTWPHRIFAFSAYGKLKLNQMCKKLIPIVCFSHDCDVFDGLLMSYGAMAGGCVNGLTMTGLTSTLDLFTTTVLF